jgi:hypothetical protein
MKYGGNAMPKLKQIEADVIIEIRAGASGYNRDGELFPYWECDMEYKILQEIASQLTLDFVERNGGGCASYIIHDFRKTE